MFFFPPQGLGNEGLRGHSGLGMTTVNPEINVGQAFGVEFFITFVLLMVVFGAAADEHNAPNVKGSAPLAIGLSITTCHLFAVSTDDIFFLIASFLKP